jgi:ATP-binding cassette subfamily F protein 3
MKVLNISQLSKSFVGETIFENLSFSVNHREKVGLVGSNGTGKTTLFRILTNQISADSGSVMIPKTIRVGYLKQNTHITSENSVYDEVREVFAPIFQMEEDMRELEHEIAAQSAHSDLLPRLMERYALLQDTYTKANGYACESELRGALRGLGFSEEEFSKPVNQLSGGQKSRVILAKLLLEKADLLLMDEPTNHLDLAAIEWLEKYIRDYPGAVLVISHDRYFLDATVQRILHLHHQQLDSFPGNYSDFIVHRQKLYAELEKRYMIQQKEIKRQEVMIRDFMDRKSARSIRQAKSRQKMLDRMKKMDTPSGEQDNMKLRFSPRIKSGNEVLQISDLSKSYGDQEIFHDLAFSLYRQERIGLIGPNGVGKTTLFRVLLGEILQSAGEVNFGHHVHAAHFDQEHTNLNPNKTIVDEIWDENPTFDHYRIRSLLARFLFFGDDLFKEIDALSGGEKARLALLKLMLSEANFLLMDEPTNHLDLESKEALENALMHYDGTLFVISHDRYFLNRVATRIFDLTDHGIKSYMGNYNYYLEKKNEIVDASVDPIPTNKTALKAERKRKKDEEKKKRQQRKNLQELENAITEKEAAIEDYHSQLCLEEVYTDPERSRLIHQSLEETETALNEALEAWTELIEILEEE